MEYNFLPGTDVKVSKICLGTMTFGEQNTEAEGHEQMDYALANGVNFFDTAELYPVPPRPETQGETDRIIGSWFQKTGHRDKVILASKIVGPAPFAQHIRSDIRFSKASIDDAIHKGLKRLQTDYIDLYQLHWPERPTNFFGKRGYDYDPDEPIWEENFQTVLEALKAHVEAGNIRYIGLSNESTWGVMKFLQAAGETLPKMITVQNPYSLLNRLFEVGSAEICHRDTMGLLAYSPLGFGTLTGKYLHGRLPEKSRLKLFPHYDRYSNGEATAAIKSYAALAQEHGLSLTHLSLAFVNDRPFMTSNIIGATTLAQLKENIASAEVTLSEEVLNGIEAIHKKYPNPAP